LGYEETKHLVANRYVVRADNVAEYVIKNRMLLKDVITFPNIVPPFERMFVEAVFTPNKSVDDMKKALNQIIGFSMDDEGLKSLNITDEDLKAVNSARYGYTIERIKIEDFIAGQTIPEGWIEQFPNIRWVCVCDQWLRTGQKLYHPEPDYRFVMGINKNGEICISRDNGSHSMFYQRISDSLMLDLESRYVNPSDKFVFVPMTFAFMNCKNIVIEEVNKRDPGEKKKRNRYKRPEKPYHIIKIIPMSTKRKLGGSGTSIQPSIHIRRGHFKDYRIGPGLFGKFNDIYWWDATTVGHSGELKPTEYNVFPPKPE
jgi:hypothetical protein